MWDSLNIRRLQMCIENKEEFDKVFPSFIVSVGEQVKEILSPRFPKMQEWVGPYGREKTRQLHPDMQEPFYLDWVCFGFEGYPAEAAHVGVLFDLNHWPVTYRIGVHAVDSIWRLREQIVTDERTKLNEEKYVYDFQSSFKEHQFNDLQKKLNFLDLTHELETITARVEHLYSTFNPLFSSP